MLVKQTETSSEDHILQYIQLPYMNYFHQGLIYPLLCIFPTYGKAYYSKNKSVSSL